jgi:diguanylate cyclase (GGDEF)-like protein
MESPGAGRRPNGAEDVERARQTAGLLRDVEAAVAGAAVESLNLVGAGDGDASLLGTSIARLLCRAVGDGHCDPRQDEVTGLVAIVSRLTLEPAQVGRAIYAAMNAGSTAVAAGVQEDAPAVSMIQRAAFDVLAAWMTRALEQPTLPALTDRLTTLHTRVVLDTVILKECRRAERFEHWLSLLLIDLDHLSELNHTRGYGVGDQVLERMGVLIRKYFRQQDWVARYSQDVVAVLLPETGPEDAVTLANLMRTMLEERVALDDERQQPVTVSVAVASARPLNGYPIDADRLLDEADAALVRAKDGDRERVEIVEIHPVIASARDSTADD